jgi:hypothetical protein
MSPLAGRFLGRDPIGYSDGLDAYSFVMNDPFNNLDPSGMTGVSVCAAVRFMTKFPPIKKKFSKFEFEFRDESFFEGRECQIDCDCGTKGVTFEGSYTHRGKIKIAFPLGVIPIGPLKIPVKIIGGGEGGAKFSVSSNSCTGEFKKSGCGYWSANFGIEGCIADPFELAFGCLKGEYYYRQKWCLDGKSETCHGGRIAASFCYGWKTQSCREYILIDVNDCSDGGAGT